MPDFLHDFWIQLFVMLGGFGIQLISLIIAVSNINRSATRHMIDMEVRNAERYSILQTKMTRVEEDVQTLFRATSSFNRRHETSQH